MKKTRVLGVIRAYINLDNDDDFARLLRGDEGTPPTNPHTKTAVHPFHTRQMRDPHGRFAVQHLYRFENGYGASVVHHPGREAESGLRSHPKSYGHENGNGELAAIRWLDPKDATGGYAVHSDNPVIGGHRKNMGGVLGNLDPEEVQDALHEIKHLPKPPNLDWERQKATEYELEDEYPHLFPERQSANKKTHKDN